MALQALVLCTLALVPPPAAAPPAVGREQIWELAVTVSAAVVYRMDSMPARLHKTGDELLQDAKRLAARSNLPLPEDSALRGAEIDTVQAMGYLMAADRHPTAQFLQQHQGRPAAALFEFGLLSHLAMTSVAPGSDGAKGLADMVETAARDSGLARDTWSAFTDALRTGKTPTAAKAAMSTMITVVGRACGR